MASPVASHEALRQAYDAVAKHGNVVKAAKALRMSRRTLSTLFLKALDRLGLPDPRQHDLGYEGFIAHKPTIEKERSLEELLQYKRQEAQRSLDYDDETKIIRIGVKADGPIGIMAVGDCHLDSPGCDFASLERDLAVAAEGREYILTGNIGDVRDNWISRLTRLYADSTVSARETLKLVEWLFAKSGVRWAWLIRGNHDTWSGHNDPLDFISKGAGVGADMPHGARLFFLHPNKAVTRVHARHDFPGHSQYNSLHGLKRESLFGHRDHCLIAGHRHVGGDSSDVHGDGTVFSMVRLAGYKKVDSYQKEQHFVPKPIHQSALIIVDPYLPDSSRGRVWVAPTTEEGADYLKFKRERFNARPRRKAAAKRT